MLIVSRYTFVTEVTDYGTICKSCIKTEDELRFSFDESLALSNTTMGHIILILILFLFSLSFLSTNFSNDFLLLASSPESQLKGKAIKISELRNGTLLIEVRNEEQSKNIQKIEVLAGVKVKVTPHSTLNTIRGTIRYNNLPRYDNDTILKELRSQGVTNLYQVKRKK